MIKATHTHTHTSAVMVDVDIVLGSSRSKDSHKSRENTVFTRNVSQFERVGFGHKQSRFDWKRLSIFVGHCANSGQLPSVPRWGDVEPASLRGRYLYFVDLSIQGPMKLQSHKQQALTVLS